MAISIQVDGLASIKIAAGAGALELLGYSENGVEITEQGFSLPVHGDENGGDAGPPIDIQDMGEMHIVRMLLTKYDEAVLNKIRARLAAGTAGTPNLAGTLAFASANLYRLLIHSVNRPRNYFAATFLETREINKGTKHSKALVIAQCYSTGPGVAIYNATVV